MTLVLISKLRAGAGHVQVFSDPRYIFGGFLVLCQLGTNTNPPEGSFNVSGELCTCGRELKAQPVLY